MACAKKQTIPANSPIVQVKAFPGELGFVEILNLSEEPQNVVGQVTASNYFFPPLGAMFVDKRDAIFILGGEFSVAGE